MGRLEALCGKIHDTHHVYLKEYLPRLAALIAEAASAAIRAESDFFRLQQTPGKKEVAG